MMRRAQLVAAAAALGLAAPVAAADAPPVERLWAVRGEAFLLGGAGVVGATTGAMAATVQRRLYTRFAWEETIGHGAGFAVPGKENGWTFAGTFRGAAWSSADGSHAVTFALGTALLAGGGFGALNFAFGEGGYEHRSPGGLSLVLAAGPDVMLSRPSTETCAAKPDFCSQYRTGGVAWVGHARLGVGWAF
jgi:hypothetical protein